MKDIEPIKLPHGWTLDHNGMSPPYRRYWLNHPTRGALFHLDTLHCENEFREFIACMNDTKTPVSVVDLSMEDLAVASNAAWLEAALLHSEKK